MSVITRFVDYTRDHEDLITWWTSQGWTPLAESTLGEWGFMTENEQGVKLAATWFFKLNNTDLGLIEWTIANPEAPQMDRREGILSSIQACVGLAKALNLKYVITMTKHPRLLEKLETTLGFKRTDEDMIHLVRSL